MFAPATAAAAAARAAAAAAAAATAAAATAAAADWREPAKQPDPTGERPAGVTGVQHLYPSELSGGMKKRVALARAVIEDGRHAGQDKLVMYDEPTAGLDPVASTVVEDLIRNMQASIPTVRGQQRRQDEEGGASRSVGGSGHKGFLVCRPRGVGGVCDRGIRPCPRTSAPDVCPIHVPVVGSAVT